MADMQGFVTPEVSEKPEAPSNPDRSNNQTFAAYWAKRIVREKLAAELRRRPEVTVDPDSVSGIIQTPFDQVTRHNLPNQSPFNRDTLPATSRICIIGAGVTGLYIAMLLEFLNIPGLSYDILEASGRTGGRMYTHYFPPDSNKGSAAGHQYYDIGAMRFPTLSIMERTRDLFHRLNIPLIPYYLDPEKPKQRVKGSVMTPTMYNDICLVDDGSDPPRDAFKISDVNGGSVPYDIVARGVDDILKEAFGPYKEVMHKSFSDGFDLLMKVDEYSTREYLRNPPDLKDDRVPQFKALDFYSIQWLETNNTSTNLFDQAFTESVIDSFDFDASTDNKPEVWQCIDGGTSLVTKAMLDRISQPVRHYKRVSKVTQAEDKRLIVSVVGEPTAREPYDTVFNTTSLGCLQRMDLTGLPLHPSLKDAIRSLHYDDSAKVAMKFSYPWWIKECGINSGGIGSTDIPLRTCVYPSYNLNDGLDQEAVLLCSYTWAQDANRIGSLIKPHSPEGEEELRELVIDNLARLHLQNFLKKKTAKNLEQVRTLIRNAYVTHHAFSWSHDPFTSGAFALFGPGQFKNYYMYLIRPTADSRFHICGEASSPHHAWIVGSLDSAYESVWNFLIRFGLDHLQDKLRTEWDDKYKAGVPASMLVDGESTQGPQWLQVYFGMQRGGQYIRL